MRRARHASYFEALGEMTSSFGDRPPWQNLDAVFVLINDNDARAAIKQWLAEEVAPENVIARQKPATFWVMLRTADDAFRFKMRWC